MMAMMSALDGHEIPPNQFYHDRQRSEPPSRRHPSPRREVSPRRHHGSLDTNSQRRRSPSNEGTRRQTSDSPNRRQLPVQDHMTQSMNMGDLNASIKRKQSPRRGHIGGALQELQNLQENTGRRRSKSPRGFPQQQRSEVNKENYSNLGGQHESVNFIPRFLRVEAERDEPEFKLPHIPVPAWEERGPQQPPAMVKDFGFPLLQLNAGYAPSQLFPGSHRVPQGQFPPPPPRISQPIPPDTPLPDMYKNMFQRMENRDKEVQANSGMPLLSLPKDKDLLGPSDAAFGRLLSPSLIVAHEQEMKQKDLLKHKHNLEFLRSQVRMKHTSSRRV